jgi:hypothetical protein
LCAKVALEPCVEAGEVDGCCGEEVIRALENEQDDRAKVNGLFGSLNS